MSKKVYIFLADGFEDIEGLTVVDLLRRAGLSRCVVQDDPCGGGPLRQRAVPLVVHLVNFHRSRPPCPPPPSPRGSL